jgi:hypothetical protein
MVQPNKAYTVTGEWECAECGYTEEGTEFERPLRCPECNSGPEAFKFTSYEEEEWDSDVEEDELDLDEDLEEDEEEYFDEDEDDLDEDDADFDEFDELDDEYDER